MQLLDRHHCLLTSIEFGHLIPYLRTAGLLVFFILPTLQTGLKQNQMHLEERLDNVNMCHMTQVEGSVGFPEGHCSITCLLVNVSSVDLAQIVKSFGKILLKQW